MSHLDFMNLGLGVDTGGTYTDAVILDFDMGKVLRKAKALTTPYDLTIGIANSIAGLGDFQTEQIKLVSVSTTLATNAVVEGRGGQVCLLAIGYKSKLLDEFGIKNAEPIKIVHVINGGHDIMGEELAPLDFEKAKRVIEETKNQVDAYAVSAYGGVRNPTHEIQLRDLIFQLTDKPVVCGHQLTSELNSIKRATTAAFNARLMPLITSLVKATQRVLEDKNITAPLMIVKGDGHIMNTQVATERPIETLLSGPAASIVGGRYLAGVNDGVVVDMGGTTTDIAVLRSGEPAISRDGASVGGWRTCVRAADIRTAGLGGDSHILLSEKGVHLSARRVIPLSLAASNNPSLLKELRSLDNAGWYSALVPPSDCLIKLRDADGMPLKGKERALLAALATGPKSLIRLAAELDAAHPTLLDTKAMEEFGLVGRIGLTPTDVLHAQGIYQEWDIEAAQVGLRLYARQLGESVENVIEAVRREVDRKLATELISKFITDESQHPSVLGCNVCSLLVDKALGVRKNDSGVSVDMRITFPLIAIGAPVQAYFPGVASLLDTKLVIPEHAEVANAVGAITGTIVETAEVTITPIYTPIGIAHFTVHTPIDKRDFDKFKDASEYAMRIAKQEAIQKAKRAGASEVELQIACSDQKGTVAKDQGGDVFLGSNIKAIAMGKSKWNEE